MLDDDQFQYYLNSLTSHNVSEIRHPDIKLADELYGLRRHGHTPEKIQSWYPFLSIDEIQVMAEYGNRLEQSRAVAEREIDDWIATQTAGTE